MRNTKKNLRKFRKFMLKCIGKFTNLINQLLFIDVPIISSRSLKS